SHRGCQSALGFGVGWKRRLGTAMDDRDNERLQFELTAIPRRTTIKALALGSLAVFAAVGIPGLANAAGAQPGWRWCSKCEGMFYAMASGAMHMGVCPAGGKHIDAGSGHYRERVGGDGGGQEAGGWGWWVSVQGLFS